MKKVIVAAVALSILFNSFCTLAFAQELPSLASDARAHTFGESGDIASDKEEMSVLEQTVEMADGDVALEEAATIEVKVEEAGEPEEKDGEMTARNDAVGEGQGMQYYQPDNAKYRLCYIEDNEGVVIIGCDKSELAGDDDNLGELIIPSEINGKTVYRIGESAFLGCSGFTGDLKLPEGLKEIGEYAFYVCSGFTGDLKLPAGLTEIGDGAFNRCSGFTGELKLPAGLEKIGESAFIRCSGFTGNLELPEGLTEIGGGAFAECSGFTGELKLPAGLTEIGDGAFAECSGFTGELKLPAGVTRIGEYAFSGCSGFTGELKLPAGLTEIGGSAFVNCSGFTGELKLPAGVTRIGEWAFLQCSGFTGELKLPTGLTEIGDYAFRSCSGFTGNLELPDGVTRIGASTFAACKGFSGKLILPAGLEEIGDHAFAWCSGFTGNLELPDGVKRIGSIAFYGCSGFTGDLKLPDALTEIGDRAFMSCNSLSKDIYLSGNVRNIENFERDGIVVSAFQRYGENDEKISTADITIHAPKGSYAETYAKENGYSYAELPIGTDSTEPEEGNDDDEDDNENYVGLPHSTAPIKNTTALRIILTTPLSAANNAAAIGNDEYLQVEVHGDVGEKAKELINSAAAGAGAKVASVFDIVLQVMSQNGAPSRKVDKLNALLTFTIAVPEGVDGNVYDFAVLRIHDGQVTILPDLDSDAATITFASDRFSAYAVVYGEKGSFAANLAAWDSVPKTEDKLPPITVPAIITFIFAAMAIVFGKKELFRKAERT